MSQWPLRVAAGVFTAALFLGLIYIFGGGGQNIANAVSYMGGVFALLAIWLYFQPVAVCTLEPYEYTPGTSATRLFKLSVHNPGNVPVRVLRFVEHFQGDAPPPNRTDFAPYFEGKTLNRNAEVPVWIQDAEMSERTGFTVRYRGWLPWDRIATCHVAPFGVTHYAAVSATAVGKATLTAKVVRASEAKTEAEPGSPGKEGE